jgi:hypothetical protein
MERACQVDTLWLPWSGRDKGLRRAKVLGCADPGAELIRRRLEGRRGDAWSSWHAYAGIERAPGWLSQQRLQSGCGGRRPKEQRASLIAYTEEPSRQGRMDTPWEGMIAGVVLGDATEAAELLGRAMKDPGEQVERMRKLALAARPEWTAIVQAAESLLGRGWEEMAHRHGDWGREGTMAVSTRHLGWRLTEAVRRVPLMETKRARPLSARAFGRASRSCRLPRS